MKITQIKPYQNNAKIHTPEQIQLIANSIKEFGFLNPIILDKNNVIVAGHGRYEAAKLLKFKDIPDDRIIRAETLTDEQIRAYRLIDNKLAELSDWNTELLTIELSEIETIDMDLFGFEQIDIPDIEPEPELEPQNKITVDEMIDWENFKKMPFEPDNEYGFPTIKKQDIDVKDFIKFDLTQVKSKQEYDKTVCFYCQDYKFERIWNNPDNYIDLLKKYNGMVSPEFSLYSDFPYALNLFQTYKNRWLGAYYQQQGIKVIPSICWGNEASLKFVCKGIEKSSIISIEVNGLTTDLKKNYNHERVFYLGIDTIMNEINPKKILVYGRKLKDMPKCCIFFEPFTDKVFNNNGGF